MAASKSFRSTRPRVEEALRLLSLLTPRSVARKRIQEQFSVSERVARLAVEQAVKELGEDFRAQMPSLREQLLRSLQHLFVSALKAGDHRSAIAVWDRVARLGGVEAAAALDPVAGPSSASVLLREPDAVRARIDFLIDHYKQAP